jgi:NAD(P)-dependent dehydrogenase (short-subunit alcohol dehydrogenase family)
VQCALSVFVLINAALCVCVCSLSLPRSNVISLIKQFKRESHSLDILVNMAGVFHPGPFAKASLCIVVMYLMD